MTDAVKTPVVEPEGRLSDNPTIVDAVQAHLDAFADIETPAETPAEATPVEEAVAETPAEATPAEETLVEEAAATPVESKASTLPAAYVRSAKARGWTDEEISGFHTANPDLSLKTFERMHASRVSEVQEWAELGRKVRQGETPVPAAAPASTPAPTPALAPINVQEMVEKYGNEDLIKELAGPINAAIAALGPVVQDAMSSREQTKQTQKDALAKTVQDFFTATDMAPYAEAYGKNLNALTPVQIEMRSKVLETADALIAGATFQGRKLSVQEALVLAHDSVASGMKETIIRDQIRTKVQKRAKGISLKPTAQGRANAGAPPRDRAELVSRTEDRLSRAFG
jgi:hypothetical protein